MRIGVPKEVKNHEYRVAITPIGVHELVSHGHAVQVGEGHAEHLHVRLLVRRLEVTAVDLGEAAGEEVVDELAGDPG